MPPLAPSLDDLRSALDRAERDLVRAEYTDDTAKMLREKASARQRIDDLTAQIARLEESF